MPVEKNDDGIVLKHPKASIPDVLIASGLMNWKGPSVEILLYGAHILSWKSGTKGDAKQTERIFLSSKALLDGSGPVRGGIPLVFPAFGAPPHAHPEHVKLGQHGFARTLAPTPKIQEVYSRPFQLAFVVTLGEHQLSTDLHVHNPAPEPLEFQALLHNYIRCPSNDVTIAPLQGKQYFDKTDMGHQGLKTEMRAAVDVRKWTDSVYEDTSGSYEITWPGGGVSIKTVNLKDLVIWNPRSEAGSKIVDMEDGGW
ncbi:hypothetical protein MPER_05682 [Moniliophthora perniciosa FA553]|nr:hypothetical protein MPER_05682 [Moniliophthora perniciosa FA553]